MSFAKEAYFKEKFTGLSLSASVMQSKGFEQCEFDACSFINCKFEKCKFLDCKFRDCILSAVVPMDCRLTVVEFSRCKAIGIDWTKAQKLEDLVFVKCQLNYSNFKLLKLPKVKMISCEAKEVDFIETDMKDGDFRHTDFEKSRFFKTNLRNADFTGAKNYFIDVKNNSIEKAKFSMPEVLALLNSLEIVIEGQEH